MTCERRWLQISLIIITLKDLENDWDDVISTSIMLRAERDAANIDWDAIPSDQLVVGTEVLSYISKPRKAKRAKHQELQDVTNCAVFEASSKSTSASRFGNTVTCRQYLSGYCIEGLCTCKY